MRKIVITGPESTGKSSLSKQLADYYKVEPVPEYARIYLNNKGGLYNQKDLTLIAKGQIELEEKALKTNAKFVFCDTSLEVIKIWSEFKYGTCDSFIINSLSKRQPNLYLLLEPDLPWQQDPLRENPNNRIELFDIYKKELSSYNIPHFVVSGKGENRFEMAKRIIETNLL